MHLKYLLCDINACGYPTNHPLDKCFELSVSRNRLWWMVWSNFHKHVCYLEPHRYLCHTDIPCPAGLAGLQHSLWWHTTGWVTFRSWQSPRSIPMLSLGCSSILLSNLSIWESSHTVEFDLALIKISPLFQSADKQLQLTKSLVPYNTDPG